MATLLAKVGRDPKTCTAQIASFCSGGTTDIPVGDTKADQGQRRKNDVDNADVSSDSGEEKSQGKHRRGDRTRARGVTGGNREASQRDKPNSTRVKAKDHERAGLTAPSTASLAEVLACFGFVFEGTSASVKPSVAEAFAMLRLHAQPAEARVAGEAARRYPVLVAQAFQPRFYVEIFAGLNRPGRRGFANAAFSALLSAAFFGQV